MVCLVSVSMFAGYLYHKGEAENCDDLCTTNQYWLIKFFGLEAVSGGTFLMLRN